MILKRCYYPLSSQIRGAMILKRCYYLLSSQIGGAMILKSVIIPSPVRLEEP